jgi:glutamine---fructose-6-phosphate transaminase (isomerizing)
MMALNPMAAQIHSLPALIRESFDAFDDLVRRTLDHNLCLSVKRVFLAGCGDSHHAALGAELAFEALAGVPTEPMTALQFARYAAGYLPPGSPNTNLVIGISASGAVSRTVEAVRLARGAGAATLALTATAGSPLAETAELVLLSTIPPFPAPPGVHPPATRSYLAHQLLLLLIAVRLGEVRGRLDWRAATDLRHTVRALAEAAEQTLAACDGPARAIAEACRDANEFVFVGGGPSYGAAVFSAAKVLEASGDTAFGQDTEEWAHLQYFARAETTPTFFISAGRRDLSRAAEVAVAAGSVGRRIIAVAPPSASALNAAVAYALPLAEGVPEPLSPLVASIPGALFAAYRAEVIGEPYFRRSGQGRDESLQRIRTSEMWETIQP